jgi:TolB-like protein/Flp pilus assembly protein TadD
LKLRTSLFGSFRLTRHDGTELHVAGKKLQALVAVLCVHGGSDVERDTLSQLFWPSKSQSHARASLRQLLLRLKQQLTEVDQDLLIIGRDRVSIDPNALKSDLSELQSALETRDATVAADRLLAIGARPLLGQMNAGPGFERWLKDQRAQIDQRIQSATESLIGHLEETGRTLEAGRLRDAWRLRASGGALSDTERRTRIAVLPFHILEEDQESTIVKQGLFDDLITTLGQMTHLLVAGRTSSLNARSLGRRLPRIAEALHVSYLLDGSIQRHGEKTRVHVSLVDGHNGFELWGFSHEGSSDDILSLQEQIATATADRLRKFLKLEDSKQAGFQESRDHKPNPAALDLYLQGRALTMRAIGDGVLARAIEVLEKALAIDPDFAAGWTALAEAHAYTAVYTPCLDRVAQSSKLAECAAKAIELEPNQGHARALLGIHRWTQNDPRGALDLAFEGYRLEPDNPDVTIRLGSFLLYIGRTRDALPYIQQAVEQDPVNGRNFAMLSVAQLNLGNLDEAIKAGQRMVDLGLPSMWLAVATAASGEHELAVSQYWQTRLLMNTVIFPPAGTRPLTGQALKTYWKLAAKGVCSGRKVHRALYCTMLDYLHATLPDPCDTSIVAPAIWMGYSKMVFKTLGSQITPANMYCLMSLWADKDPIRQTWQHPDFVPFAERIGLIKAWEKYGWPDLLPKPV